VLNQEEAAIFANSQLSKQRLTEMQKQVAAGLSQLKKPSVKKEEPSPESSTKLSGHPAEELLGKVKLVLMKKDLAFDGPIKFFDSFLSK
jgi:hypothetical protein